MAELAGAQLRPRIAEVPAADCVASLAGLEAGTRGADDSEWVLNQPFVPVAEALALASQAGAAALAARFDTPECGRGGRRGAYVSFEAQHPSTAASLRAAGAEILCKAIGAGGVGSRLTRLLEAAGPDLAAKLRLGADVTIRRSAGGSHGTKAAWEKHNPSAVHSDSWDGTILCFALASNKMGTPVYPAARFPRPLKMFLSHSRTGRRYAHQLEDDPPGGGGSGSAAAAADAAAARTALLGPLRPWRPGTLVVMPACVAHSKPFEADPDPDAPRWFCRATLRVDVAGRRARAREGHEQRLEVALLVAEHVWEDPAFVAAARALRHVVPFPADPDAAAAPKKKAKREVYSGETDAQGRPHGTGRCDFLGSPEGVYEGQWADGERHGRGVFTFKGGRVYDGEWARGKKDGLGTYRWTNGETYTGRFAKGKPVDPAALAASRASEVER